jgi:hypothetical protein
MEERKCLVHSLVSDAGFRKTRWYKKGFGEHNLATGLARRLATMPGNDETNEASQGQAGQVVSE